MMATLNSGERRWRRKRLARPGRFLGFACFLWLFAFLREDALIASDRARFADRAQKVYESAKKEFTKAAGNAGKAWRFAHACFDRAEYSTSKAERADLAKEGIAASRVAIRFQPKLAAGHYFLAMNLGQLARTKNLRALPIVDELESSLNTARRLDPKFHHAGADRSLGLLYRDAPGWPLSVGNRKKARLHLVNAVRLDPAYPENRLCLLESLIEWDDKKSVRSEFAATRAVLTRAREILTGEDWEANWADWDSRWAQLKVAAARDFSIR